MGAIHPLLPDERRKSEPYHPKLPYRNRPCRKMDRNPYFINRRTVF
jgi:hypothetical protein